MSGRLTPSRLKALGNYHGVVYSDLQGLNGVTQALNEFANQYPQLFKKALAAEVTNLKKSIAATLKNYKILKAVPVPNLINATSYRGYKLAKKSAITKILQGPKYVSALAKPESVKVQSITNGFEIGHFGSLSQYAIQFQDGVPRHIDNKWTRHWMYMRLGPTMDITNYDKLVSAIVPVSPPRPYIDVLAQKCERDFVPGLTKLLEVVAQREMKKWSKK